MKPLNVFESHNISQYIPTFHLINPNCKHHSIDIRHQEVMTSRQALPLRDRFKESILDADEKKGEKIKAVKKERLDEAENLSRFVLADEKEKSSCRPSQGLQRVDNDEKRLFTPIRQGRTIPGSSRSAPLPTPPRSPIASFSDKVFCNTIEGAEKPGSEEMEEIRAALYNHEAEIASLRLRFENTKVEIQGLHRSCRSASEEVAKAMCNGDKEIINGCTQLEENLLELLKQKNEIIDELREEILQKKGREGELRERLAEAEGRQKARERKPMGQDDVFFSNPSLRKRKTLREGGKGWEFRRKKGERTTPFSASLCLLRGM